jgi:hypothetical protein
VKPLWLELMLTPMAAPETRWRRAMRLTLTGGFIAIALGVPILPFLIRVFGRGGTGMLAGLCLAVMITAQVYAWLKIRADAAHLDRISGIER